MANHEDGKVYNVSLVSYVPVSFIQEVLTSHIKQIKACSFCFHDKDEGKEPHTHILICSKMPLYVETYCNWFKYRNSNGDLENTLGEKCIDVVGSYQYLIHENDPDKFQYSSTERIVFNEDYFTVVNHTDKSILALTDVLSGVSLRECALKYGRDFIFHYTHFKALIKDIYAQEGIKDIIFNPEKENEK